MIIAAKTHSVKTVGELDGDGEKGQIEDIGRVIVMWNAETKASLAIDSKQGC